LVRGAGVAALEATSQTYPERRLMPPPAIAAALLSAFNHAAWNAALNAGKDRHVDVGMMGLGDDL
jgi:hypothetical protein